MINPANDKPIIFPSKTPLPKHAVFWRNNVRPVLWKLFMPWQIDKPVALPWGGWTKFNKEQKAKYPIRWFLFDVVPSRIRMKATHLNWKLWEFKHKYIPKHQYHVIRTSLEPTQYHDPRSRILYATMDMVKEFVEITADTVEWDSDPHHAEAWKELQIVYNWWVNEYPNRESFLGEFPDIGFEKILGDDKEEHSTDPDVIEWRRVSALHWKAEEQWDKDEEEMLIRVMRVRAFLWYP